MKFDSYEEWEQHGLDKGYNMRNPTSLHKSEDKNERKNALKNRLLLPSCLIGIILLITGIILDFPEFLNALYRSFPWMIYSLGFHLILISILIFIEESGLFHTKKSYRFLFYFSYYSFTVYATHYILTPIFRRQLDAYDIWIFSGKILS